ncbi:MAG: flagellar hook-length control protein FliK [Proteobacteria bacterium]|nr:flagellar hook-length control protein FliK [Pseudomonadota bacterium]
MPSSLALAAKHIQEIKAQSLATLMASIDPVGAAARLSGNASGNTQAALQSAEAAIRAVIIEATPDGQAILKIAGGLVEARLPPEILKAALANPNLLKPGNTLLLPADIPARALSTPATQVTLTHTATGSTVGPAPPLQNIFPAGSLGAVIAKLAGIAFPAAEPTAQPGQALPAPHAAAGIRPGLLTQPVEPEVATALLQAAGRQIPLSNALGQILATADDATLPPDLAKALGQLRNARSTPEALADPARLAEAIRKSGLFTEAMLAKGQAPQGDLKSALMTIRALLGDAGKQGEANGPAIGVQGTTRPAPDAGRLAELARAVEGAGERVKLMQLASLPNHPEITYTDERSQPMRLALQIPLATQGADRPPTAMMGVIIEHNPAPVEPEAYQAEKEGGDSEKTPFPWKVRIAVDLEETGPVQAEIGLRGQSVSVTLWAERASMAQRARAEIGALHKALTGAAFEIAKLDVKDGRPQGAPLRAAPVLDRRT